MTEFNLIDQPWIPVLAGDGTFREIGIREALLPAAEFTRLAAELPTISTAIQRLLQAVLLRAAGPLPRTPEAKARLWASGGRRVACHVRMSTPTWTNGTTGSTCSIPGTPSFRYRT